jgi:hypothetical protein
MAEMVGEGGGLCLRDGGGGDGDHDRAWRSLVLTSHIPDMGIKDFARPLHAAVSSGPEKRGR